MLTNREALGQATTLYDPEKCRVLNSARGQQNISAVNIIILTPSTYQHNLWWFWIPVYYSLSRPSFYNRQKKFCYNFPYFATFLALFLCQGKRFSTSSLAQIPMSHSICPSDIWLQKRFLGIFCSRQREFGGGRDKICCYIMLFIVRKATKNCTDRYCL